MRQYTSIDRPTRDDDDDDDDDDAIGDDDDAIGDDGTESTSDWTMRARADPRARAGARGDG